MKLSEILLPASVRIPLQSTSKADVLRELVGLLPSASDDAVRESLLTAVLDREKRMSTGIGQGIAIPHGKSDRVQQMEIAFGISSRPIEFGALDGRPVDLFFVLISPPDMTAHHIQALAQISRILSSDHLREELAAATGAEQVFQLLRREEVRLGG
jgi:mannitol/fructose-specific phosphotransferase system IIA component (Ntr-type)